MSNIAKCEICGEQMPQGEEMFKFHGYSGPCPSPPLKKQTTGNSFFDPSGRGEEVFDLVFSELKKAEIKHPSWPEDQIHAVGILVEEAGEAMKAAIDHTYAGKGVEELRTELAQTGAMALRALLHIGV